MCKEAELNIARDLLAFCLRNQENFPDTAAYWERQAEDYRRQIQALEKRSDKTGEKNDAQRIFGA
jgi:hypothetical protein